MFVDVIVLGGGAAGLMCAAQAGQQGRSVIIIEKEKKWGKKILISGGGRCNFTNYEVNPKAYISQNPHFCKSALKRYTQYHFIDLVEQYEIPYHEKTLGQLFCDNLSKDILEMLLSECQKGNVILQRETRVSKTKKLDNGHFEVISDQGTWTCESLVVATGGLSIPKAGASDFGYQIAEQFGHSIVNTRAALVPLIWKEKDLSLYKEIPGVALPCKVRRGDQTFAEAMLFTHKGLSGPAMLQISSYWKEGQQIEIDLLPDESDNWLEELRKTQGAKTLKQALKGKLPNRLIDLIVFKWQVPNKSLAQYNANEILKWTDKLKRWYVMPDTTEGYQTAEVTLGGVNTNEVSSKTFESNLCPKLYFIGEVLDVTGWLGGYNFQWAWSSAHCAAQFV